MNGLSIPNTPIVVDYWNLKDVHSRSLFFLSHMHAGIRISANMNTPFVIIIRSSYISHTIPTHTLLSISIIFAVLAILKCITKQLHWGIEFEWAYISQIIRLVWVSSGTTLFTAHQSPGNCSDTSSISSKTSSLSWRWGNPRLSLWIVLVTVWVLPWQHSMLTTVLVRPCSYLKATLVPSSTPETSGTLITKLDISDMHFLATKWVPCILHVPNTDHWHHLNMWREHSRWIYKQ